MWPCDSEEDTENDRALCKPAIGQVLEGRLVERLLVQELHGLNWTGGRVVCIVARAFEGSARRPRGALADFSACI